MTAHSLHIPDRSNDALTGSEFIASIESIPFESGQDAGRERAYLDQFMAGNIPDFMRELIPVQISGAGMTATMYVMPDYLCIGSDDDNVLVPMNPLTAQLIMDRWGGQLPTRKMVDAIHTAATIKLNFHPMTPPRFPYDHTMMTTERFKIHSEWLKKDRQDAGAELGQLISGHKKDVIIDTWLEDVDFARVGVYGARIGDRAIHDFRTHSHEVRYKDYSHGVRCVSQLIYTGPDEALISGQVLCDQARYRLLSGHNRPFKTARYPADRAGL